MKLRYSGVLAFAAIVTIANPCWGQRGVPVPRTVPRPPVPHVTPHPPLHGGSHGAGQRADDNDNSANLAWIIGGSAAGVAGLGGAFLGYRMWKRRLAARTRIRIVAIPAGEAPEAIRRAWVGLELTLAAGERDSHPVKSVSVVSNQDWQTAAGYIVDGKAAVEALEFQSFEAAAWWREHAPHVLTPGYKLSFAPEVCKKVW